MSRQLAHGLMVRLLLLLLFAFSSVTVTAKERITYFHNDLLGSPVAATNAQGEMLWQEEYTAYGKRLINADQGRNSRWFTGKSEAAALGVQYFEARWYDAELSRFLSIDPVDFQEEDIYTFNRYAYANNNPYRYVDPDGRMSLDINEPRSTGVEGVVTFNAGGGGNIGPSSGIKRGILPNGDFVESAGRINGNSLRSTRAQHGYEIHDTKMNSVVKTGASGGPRTVSGGSYRGNSQANKWNREAGEPNRYEARVVKEIPGGPGARQEILKWEAGNAARLRESGQLKDPTKHVRP